MITTELIFFVCFLTAIVGILLLDMLLIDKQANEVSIKEAGTWTAVWITLALAFSAFLWFYGDLVHGISNFQELQAISSRYASHLNLDADDYEGSLQKYRHYMTISYLSGYLIEKALSVDNLFVMMMIFASFGVKKTEYQHVLNWGILGAIIMRFIFIFAGAAIISRFEWMLMIFGVFLIYSAIKMYVNRNKEESIDAENHAMVRFLSRYFNVYPRYDGDNFFVHAVKVGNKYELADKTQKGVLCMTPLFVTMLVIEFSDLIFAFDSIPAIFSVSLDPYVVFFSNIFAILGLRAMFFLLAAIADRFRYLKVGVSILLLFIGVKLLIAEVYEIDAVASLLFIVFILVGSIAASMIVKDKKKVV